MAWPILRNDPNVTTSGVRVMGDAMGARRRRLSISTVIGGDVAKAHILPFNITMVDELGGEVSVISRGVIDYKTSMITDEEPLRGLLFY